MFLKIIIYIVIFIIFFILGYNYCEIDKIENFFNDAGKKSVPYYLNDRYKTLQLENKLNIDDTQKIAEIDENILFNNRDYNQNLSIDNKNNKYYYNDMINQSDVNETAFNIEYSIDPIDYSNVETGLDKCKRDCEGLCFENGYDGVTTCYPTEQAGFDWGTLYKNPTFTYGYNAYGPENLPQ